MNAEETSLHLGNQPPTINDPVGVQVSHNTTGPSVTENFEKRHETMDISNPWVFMSSFSGSLQHSSVDFAMSHRLAVDTPNLVPVLRSPSMVATTPMTFGQASLLGSLLSLGQPPYSNALAEPSQPTIDLLSNAPPDPGRHDDITVHDDEDPESVISVMCRQPVMDRTTASNALPFLLQGYAKWIHRMAFEPLKAMGMARDLVFSHFEDGGQSRWIITLLANIGSRIGSVDIMEEAHNSTMMSALQTTVRARLGTVKAHRRRKRLELAKALDCALETLIMHFFISPVSEAVALRLEAAPVFRQLCPEPPNSPINLPLLLQHPLGCLRHYAHIDILFSINMDIPTLFRYEVTSPSSQPSSSLRSVPAIQGDGIIQWLHGMPNQLLILFAMMKLMRHDGLIPDRERVASLEQDIREVPAFTNSSSERFLSIVRFVVRECWRQVAFVYLYMAVCGDPCNTPRVNTALKRFVKLLRGMKPGRFPDEFLILTFLLISPAAQQKRDRDIIRQRFLGLYTLGKTFHVNNSILCVIEDYWARADAERRPTMWSDIGASRKRVLGV